MSLSYLSVCSGIEAATVAWHPLGWKPWGFSEIEKFPCALLKHHYPDVPNYGDMTKFEEWPDANISVLVGGTPCQSFSVAGLRKGLSDPRGNLMLTFGSIARRYRPRWLVWENVPGVLSSNGGRDFGTFLGMLAELGYGFAYRVLDAQYFGVAQRRRRVFVVGHLGDWRPAAAVLFERDSLQGNPAPRRETGKEVAGTFMSGSGSGGWSNSIDHAAAGYMQVQSFTAGSIAEYKEGIGTLRANGGDIGGGSETLVTAFHPTQDPISSTDGTTHALSCGSSGGQASCAVATSMSVRRLTPIECERLQGFPDDYTAIPHRGKPAADGPRYKALGNSMAVPVMRWIGRRISDVDAIMVAA